jgi:hypothetical protein
MNKRSGFFKNSALILTLLAVGCAREGARNPNAAQVAAEVEKNRKFKLVEFLNSKGLETSSEPTLLPSQVFKKQTPDRQKIFVKTLIKAIVTSSNVAGLIKPLVERSFGFTKDNPDFWKSLAQADGMALDIIATEIIEKANLTVHPENLDKFPMFAVEEIPPIQQALFSAGVYTPNPPPPQPFRVVYANPKWKDIVLLGNTCVPPSERNYEKVFEDFEIYTGMQPISNYAVSCFAENSEAISQLLNVLSNTIVGEKVAVTISMEGKDQKFPVTSYETLVTALAQMGFTIELYNARVLVDFLGWSYKDVEDTKDPYKSIRIATWFNLPIPGKRVTVPAEHGEIGFMIRNSINMRVAAARWFLGVPDANFKGTATFWRPHTSLEAPWGRYIHEWANVYPPHSGIKELSEWFVSTAYVMKGFDAIQQKFNPPANSYGLFICSDSLTFATVKHNVLAGLKMITNAFPTLYAQEVALKDPPEKIKIPEVFSKAAEIDPATLRDSAPADQNLSPKALKDRLRATFQPKDDLRLELFPQFRDNDLKAIRQ